MKSNTKRVSSQAKISDQHHLLFQNNPLPMWVYDLETLNFLEVNEAAVEHYGYSRDEFLKMRITDIRLKEDVALVEKHAKAKRPRLQHSGEWKHLKKNGSLIHVEITSHKITFEGRKAVLVAANDITDRKLLETIARANETSYHDLFNSVDEAIYIQDRKGRFLDVNDGAVKMYGYPREYLIGKTPAAISAPGKNDMRKVLAAIKKAFNGEPQEIEFWGLRSNGEVFPKNVRLYKGSYLGQDVLIALARDITERKRTEESLTASEEKYRTLIEQILSPVYINPVDNPTVTNFISPQIETMLGYTDTEWMEDPKLWKKSLHPEDRQRVLTESERMTASGDSTNIEYRIFARDGRVVWIHDQAVLVRDAEGKPKFWQGLMMDITERKQAEEKLASNEKRFRAMAENSSDLILVMDANGQITYVSPSLKRILGYSLEEVLGKPFINWIHPEELARATTALSKRKHFLGADRKPVIFRVRHRDGSWRLVEGVGNNLLNNPAVAGIVINCRDVTEQKQAEESRHTTEAKYRALVEKVTAVFYVDAVDDVSSTIYISPQVEAWLGYKPEDWTTKPGFWKTVIHPDDYAAWQAESIRTNQTGEPFKMEYRLVACDGRIIWIRDEAVLIRDDSGQPLYWQGVHFDITGRKQAEAELNAIFASMPDVVLVLDRDGRYLKIAPTNPRLLHLPAEMMLGKRMHEVFSQQKADELVGHIREALDKKETINFEYALLIQDRIVWFSGTTSPLTDDSVVWVGRDITARKQTEDALLASQDLLNEAQRIGHIGSWELDLEKNILNWSDEIFRMFEIDHEKFGASYDAFLNAIHPDDRALVDKAYTDSVKNKTPYSITHRLLFADGRIKYVHESCETFYDAIGNPIRSVGTVQDITERQQADDFLQQRLRELSIIYDSSQRLQQILTPESLATELISLLKGIFNYEHAVILLSGENGKLIPFAVSDQEHWFKSFDEYKEKISEWDFQLGAGIIGWVTQNGQSVRLDDVRRDPRYKTLQEDVRSELCVPLRVGENVIGVINVESISLNAFTESNQRLLETLAAQIAIAIQNARLFEAEHLRRQEAETLRNAANALTSSLDLETVLNSLLEGLALVVSFNSAAVFLKENRNYRAIAARGFDPPELVKGQILSGENILAKIIVEERRPLLLPDAKADDRFENWGPADPIRGWMGVPLILRDEAIGYLTIDSHHPNAFTEANAEMALTFASHAAAAIQNARLYEDAIRRMAELEVLYDSGLSLGKSLEPREISEKVVSVLAERLNWHHAALRVRRGESEDMDLLAFSQVDSKGRKEKVDTNRLMPGRAISKVGQGMAGWVIQHGRSINCGDLDNDPRYYPTFPGMKSGLHVPIWAGGRVLGCISVETERPNAFMESDERLLTTLASQAASALENARLYQGAVRSAERSRILHAASQEIASISQDPEQVYASIHHAASQLLPGEVFVVTLLSDEQDRIDAVYLFDKDGRQASRSFPLSQGMSGRVISTGQSLLINDDLENQVDAIHFGSPNAVRSIVAVPMRVSGRVIGMISVQSYEPGMYTAEDQLLLELLAAQAAIAIQNARLFTEAQDRIMELEALNRASQALTGTLDLAPLLENILRSAQEAISGAEKGTILLKDKDSEYLRMMTQIGYEDERILHLPFNSEKGYSGRSFREKRPILINDASEFSLPFEDGVDEVNAVKSGIVAPLVVKGKAIGVIALDNATRKSAFTENDLDLLTIFASSAASVIENSRLFEETHRRAEEFSSLYETARDISAEHDLNKVLNTVAERAAALLHVSVSGIYLYDRERNDIYVAVSKGFESSIGVRLQMGEGVAGHVAQTREPIIIDDYQTWENRSPQYFDSKIRAVLEVPMLYGGELIGVLTADEVGDSARKFTKEDAALLSLFASNAASVVHNARLLAETQRRAEEFSNLYETARNISNEQDLNSLLRIIVQRAADMLHAPDGGIYLFDAEDNTLELSVELNPNTPTGTRLKLDEGAAGKAALTREPLIIEDYRTWEGRSLQYKDAGFRAVLEVPMIYSGELIGVLVVDEIGDSDRKYTEADARLLSLLASHAASAVHNARLLVETRRRAEEFEALYKTAADVSAQSDLKIILNTIIERARILSGASGSGLYLFDSERGDLELVAIHDPYLQSGVRLKLGEGLSGRAAEAKQPIMVEDYRIWEYRSPIYKDIPYTSVLGIPMLYSGELIGVLNVQNFPDQNGIEHHKKFSEQDISLLSLFANSAAGVVYSARLLDQTRLRLDELAALAETSAALRSATTRTQMTSVILEQLMSALKSDGAGLVSVVLEHDGLFVEDARGYDAPYIGTWISAGEGISSHIIATGETYSISDVRTDPRLLHPDLNGDVRAVAIVPLKSQDKIIGAVTMSRAEKDGIMPPPFSASDMRMLASIADMAANALQRHNLHEETTRYAGQLVIINDLGRDLSESLDLPHIYEKLSRSTLELLPNTVSVFISLLDSHRRIIQTVYGLHDGLVMDSGNLPSLPFDETGFENQSNVIYNGRPLIVPDLNEAIKSSKAILIEVEHEGRRLQSALYVPMKSEGRVIGVLQVQSYIKNRYLSADARLLELIANTAASAIQNGRLFAQLTRRVGQLSALHSVDTSISSTTDLRVSLQSVLESVTRELKVDAADVLIFNPSALTLEYGAGIGFFTTEAAHTILPLGKGQAGLAALERRMIHISKLSDVAIGFADSNLIADERFVSYTAVPLMAKGEVRGVLELFHRSILELGDDWTSFLETLANQAALAIDNSMLFEGMEKANIELNMAYNATIEGWSQALELRDQETQGHSVRVLELTLRLAAEMGIADQALQDIRRGVLLHDIGKMGIPDSILHKPGKLTDEEWKIMHMHPQHAYNMLSSIAYLHNSLDVPYCHHEKWDGSGYPRGLSGEAIPLAARIFCIVDVFDALTSDRPYRKAWSKEKTLDYIREQTGTYFDPRVSKVFFDLMQK